MKLTGCQYERDDREFIFVPGSELIEPATQEVVDGEVPAASERG